MKWKWKPKVCLSDLGFSYCRRSLNDTENPRPALLRQHRTPTTDASPVLWLFWLDWPCFLFFVFFYWPVRCTTLNVTPMSHFQREKKPTSVKRMIPAWHQMSTTVYHLLAICISTANKLTSITINFMFRRLLKETKTSHSSSKASKCRIEDPESSIRHLDSESINGESLQQKKTKKKNHDKLG